MKFPYVVGACGAAQRQSTRAQLDQAGRGRVPLPGPLIAERRRDRWEARHVPHQGLHRISI